jgi:hypothetical protein
MASEIQRWLIRASAKSVRDELGGQVRKALRGDSGQGGKGGDAWATATTERPGDEPPECAWCPVCRAARRIGQARAEPGGPLLAEAADVVAGAVRDALVGLDTILSYRPGEPDSAHRQAPEKERPDEPDHRS